MIQTAQAIEIRVNRMPVRPCRRIRSVSSRMIFSASTQESPCSRASRPALIQRFMVCSQPPSVLFDAGAKFDVRQHEEAVAAIRACGVLSGVAPWPPLAYASGKGASVPIWSIAWAHRSARTVYSRASRLTSPRMATRAARCASHRCKPITNSAAAHSTLRTLCGMAMRPTREPKTSRSPPPGQQRERPETAPLARGMIAHQRAGQRQR